MARRRQVLTAHDKEHFDDQGEDLGEDELFPNPSATSRDRGCGGESLECPTNMMLYFARKRRRETYHVPFFDDRRIADEYISDFDPRSGAPTKLGT